MPADVHVPSAAVNVLWSAASAGAWARFRGALRSPAAVQARVLSSCLRRNRDTAFGRAHGFDGIRSIAEYQARVPPASYDDLAPLVHRVARGDRDVLTAAPVERLVPTSGSTAAAKLIPFTADLQREFTAAIDAWLVDLFLARPSLAGGRSYWSISPVAQPVSPPAGCVVPIGFDSDSRYLAGARQTLARIVLAVPDAIAGVAHVDAFRYATALLLLRARDLRLVSVWHPSFLEGLLDAVDEHRDRLIHDLERGCISFPNPGPSASEDRARLAPYLRPVPARAAELRSAGHRVRDVWPRLSLISCWADGPSAGATALLGRRCDGIDIQAKGLLATEAVVTIPFAGRHPLALRSHFFEFVDSAGGVRLAHQLERGIEYTVLVTTGGGLYRYHSGDRVIVDGWVRDTPSLQFIGKDDRVSDLFGEKLSDGFVARVLADLFGGAVPRFALLAPDRGPAGVAYTLFVSRDGSVTPDLAIRLEQALRRNPQYAWCVELGQLRPAAVAPVGAGAARAFVDACLADGRRLGEIKAVSLATSFGWRDRLVQPDVEAAC